MTLRERAKQLKRDIPALFLALRHRDTPWIAKALAFVTVAYALSPVDLVPDFIPVLGYLDDLILLPGLAALTIRCIPGPVMDHCRKEAEDMWQSGKPKRWYYAIPVVLFWFFLLWLVIRALFF